MQYIYYHQIFEKYLKIQLNDSKEFIIFIEFINKDRFKKVLF